MGVSISFIHGFQDPREDLSNNQSARSVEALALRVLQPLLPKISGKKVSHFVVATSCPDSIAPSLGQALDEQLHAYFENTTTYDIVQGCAGGVSALILGSQLAALNRSRGGYHCRGCRAESDVGHQRYFLHFQQRRVLLLAGMDR